MKDERIGRLHGVPVTIKDLAITKDMPTQMGSHIFAGNQPTEDTPIVPRLRDEGAIILGKTTTSEFGWTGVSHSPADRHHAQSVEARLQRRRVIGRCGCGGRGGLRPAASGQRRRGFDPHAGALLRRVRTEAHVRPRAVLSGGQRRLHLAHGPDDAHRRRQRADAARDGGAASARSHDLRGRTCGLSRPPARRRARQAHRLQPRSRRRARRSRRGGAGEVRGRALHRTRRHGRGSEDAVGRARSRDDPLLLGRAHDAPDAAPREVGSEDGSGPGRLHQGRARILGHRLPD